MIKNKTILVLSFILLTSEIAGAQSNPIPFANQLNTITTAVPFLTIDGNAQSMGSGWVGVVASDIYSQNGLSQNPAILSRGKKILGFQFNYVPWLRQLVPNVNFLETGYYHSINKNNTLGFSARYFSLGEIIFTDDHGVGNGNFKPFEYAVGLKYAHNFSEYFSIGSGIKYVHSDLTGGKSIAGFATHPAQALAGELGFDYRRNLIQDDYFNLRWNAGLSFLNIGNKVNYVNGAQKDFLPQTMKAGTLFTLRWSMENDNYIACDFSYQADKLLVPTPPVFARDQAGNRIPDGRGGFKIERGMDPNVSSLEGAFQSFRDAPGGYVEELREIIHQFGAESRISMLDNKILVALRGGYFFEQITKGNRKFMTMGLGLGVAGLQLNLSYMLPAQQNHPLQNTIGISLNGRFNLYNETFFRFKEQ